MPQRVWRVKRRARTGGGGVGDETTKHSRNTAVYGCHCGSGRGGYIAPKIVKRPTMDGIRITGDYPTVKTRVRSYVKHADGAYSPSSMSQKNRSTDRPTDYMTNQPFDQSTNEPINQSTNKPTNQSYPLITSYRVPLAAWDRKTSRSRVYAWTWTMHM